MGAENTVRSNQDVEYLFVYGTLRKDAGNDMYRVLARHARFVGSATFQGKLFDLGNYPGAVPSDDPQDVVCGEVYALEPSLRDGLLATLDEYEGCSPGGEPPSEFRREYVTVTCNDGRSASSWIYLYNLAGVNSPIPSGDYVRYLKGKGANDPHWRGAACNR